jgi:hypothetical protein
LFPFRLHEPPEKRPISMAKRRASSFCTQSKPSVIQNKIIKTSKPSSQSPDPKNTQHNNGNGTNFGKVNSRSQPDRHVDLSLSPSSKTSFSPIDCTPTKNNNQKINKIISHVFSPSSKLFSSPSLKKLGLPQRVLSPDVKGKPRVTFERSGKLCCIGIQYRTQFLLKRIVSSSTIVYRRRNRIWKSN